MVTTSRVSRVPSLDNALSYVISLKDELHDEPATYKDLLEIIQDYTDDSADNWKARISHFVKSHPNLLLDSKVLFPEVDKPKTNEGNMSVKEVYEEVLGQFQAMVKLEPTMNDALSYINSLKEALHDEPEKYDEFLKLVLDVNAHRLMDEESGIARMTEIIREHPKLLHDLKFFLPRSEITSPYEAMVTNLPMPDSTIPPEASRTIPPEAEQLTNSDEFNFMNMLKTRFRKLDTHVVGSFLEIMEMYNKGKKSVKEVQEEVVDLLYYHEDLIDEFSRIFPGLGSFTLS